MCFCLFVSGPYYWENKQSLEEIKLTACSWENRERNWFRKKQTLLLHLGKWICLLTQTCSIHNHFNVCILQFPCVTLIVWIIGERTCVIRVIVSYLIKILPTFTADTYCTERYQVESIVTESKKNQFEIRCDKIFNELFLFYFSINFSDIHRIINVIVV